MSTMKVPDNEYQQFLRTTLTVTLRIRPGAKLTNSTVHKYLRRLLFVPITEPSLNNEGVYRVLMTYKNLRIESSSSGVFKQIIRPALVVRATVDALMWEIRPDQIMWGQITDIDYSQTETKFHVNIFDHFQALLTLPKNQQIADKEFSEYQLQSWVTFKVRKVAIRQYTFIVKGVITSDEQNPSM